MAEAFGRGDQRRMQGIFKTSVRWALIVVTPVAVVLYVFAEDILGVFGEEFVVGRWALRLLVVGFWFRAALGSVSGVVTMGGASRAMLYITLGATGVNVVANYVLIRLWGIEGAALATGGITAASGLALLVTSMRLFDARYELMPFLKVLGVAAVATGLGLGVQLAMNAAPGALRGFVVTAVLVGTFVVGAKGLKLLDSRDRVVVRHALERFRVRRG
jgi:O-antigen/teichoic acid export membrane protein